MTENIRNLKLIKIDAASRQVLLQRYTEYANFEFRQRTFMEEEMRTRLSVKDPSELPAGYSIVKAMPNREQVPEDAHQCHYCTDFAYFSLINCTNCNINYCIWHNVHCGCNVPAVQLIYRFSNEELRSLKQIVKLAVKQDRAKAHPAGSSDSSSLNL